MQDLTVIFSKLWDLIQYKHIRNGFCEQGEIKYFAIPDFAEIVLINSVNGKRTCCEMLHVSPSKYIITTCLRKIYFKKNCWQDIEWCNDISVNAIEWGEKWISI